MTSPYDYLLDKKFNDLSNYHRIIPYFERKSELIDAYKELLENEFTVLQLINTKIARLGDFAAECDKPYAEGRAINAIKLIEKIRTKGIDPSFRCLIIVDNDGDFLIRDGTHRTCILKAMNLPTPGIVNKIQAWPKELSEEKMIKIAKEKDKHYGE